ncbi:hypothetical protein [uncultured Thiodictyon sp.]|uniref:hypothetical protein n=1 Tax=uncultured Thiodictyon sp. TaxID=1846217 RepID=UPI0025F04B98|nr:hypothetical protein [uncultured Thiodictyon sp.]
MFRNLWVIAFICVSSSVCAGYLDDPEYSLTTKPNIQACQNIEDLDKQFCHSTKTCTPYCPDGASDCMLISRACDKIEKTSQLNKQFDKGIVLAKSGLRVQIIEVGGVIYYIRSEDTERQPGQAGESPAAQRERLAQAAMRKSCEVQRATCLASCPPYTSSYNEHHYSCERQCKSISCY